MTFVAQLFRCCIEYGHIITKMRKDLRIAYLSSLGFREVQTKNSLEAVLKENEIDKTKLSKICEHFQIPPQYRCKVWKIMLGVLPQFQEAWEFTVSQMESQYDDLKRACQLVDADAHKLFHKVKWSTFALRTKMENRLSHSDSPTDDEPGEDDTFNAGLSSPTPPNLFLDSPNSSYIYSTPKNIRTPDETNNNNSPSTPDMFTTFSFSPSTVFSPHSSTPNASSNVPSPASSSAASTPNASTPTFLRKTISPFISTPNSNSNTPNSLPPDLEQLLTDAAIMLSVLYRTKRTYFDLSSSPSSPEAAKIDDETCIHGDEYKDDNGHIIAIAKVFCSVCDTETDAFWCFHNFLNNPLQGFGHRSTGIYQQVNTLSRLMELHDMELWQFFKKIDIRLEQFAYCWFKSYFAACMPVASLFTLWDKIIGVSENFMPFIALAMLQTLRRRVLRKPDPNSVLSLLRFPNITVDSFMHKAIDMYNTMTTTEGQAT